MLSPAAAPAEQFVAVPSGAARPGLIVALGLPGPEPPGPGSEPLVVAESEPSGSELIVEPAQIEAAEASSSFERSG